jgi:hypothetical protein
MEEAWGGGGPRGGGQPVGGVDHHADVTELIMYCIYEYKYTKYLIEHK